MRERKNVHFLSLSLPFLYPSLLFPLSLFPCQRLFTFFTPLSFSVLIFPLSFSLPLSSSFALSLKEQYVFIHRVMGVAADHFIMIRKEHEGMYMCEDVHVPFQTNAIASPCFFTCPVSSVSKLSVAPDATCRLANSCSCLRSLSNALSLHRIICIFFKPRQIGIWETAVHVPKQLHNN